MPGKPGRVGYPGEPAHADIERVLAQWEQPRLTSPAERDQAVMHKHGRGTATNGVGRDALTPLSASGPAIGRGLPCNNPHGIRDNGQTIVTRCAVRADSHVARAAGVGWHAVCITGAQAACHSIFPLQGFDQ